MLGRTQPGRLTVFHLPDDFAARSGVFEGKEEGRHVTGRCLVTSKLKIVCWLLILVLLAGGAAAVG